jgi:hypothetical protein
VLDELRSARSGQHTARAAVCTRSGARPAGRRPSLTSQARPLHRSAPCRLRTKTVRMGC